jgi:hypothetical protein
LFIRKIGKIGRGSGEYINIEDFTIDENTGNIVILTNNSTIYTYTQSGDFVTKKILDKSLLWNIVGCGNRFISTTNQLTYTEGENAFLIYLFDNDFQLVEKEIPVLPIQMYTPSMVPACLKTAGNSIVYTDVYTNRSYLIEESVKSCKAYTYQLKNPMPLKIFHSTNLFMQEQLNYDYIKENVFLDDYILTFYSEQGTLKLLLSKKDGTYVTSGIYWGVLPSILWTDGNSMIATMTTIEYNHLKEVKDETEFHEDEGFILVKLKLKHNIQQQDKIFEENSKKT